MEKRGREIQEILARSQPPWAAPPKRSSARLKPTDSAATRARSAEEAESLAEQIRANSGGRYFFGAATIILGPDLHPAVYEQYLRHFMRDCGDPSDPIERLMIEQIVLAHH